MGSKGTKFSVSENYLETKILALGRLRKRMQKLHRETSKDCGILWLLITACLSVTVWGGSQVRKEIGIVSIQG